VFWEIFGDYILEKRNVEVCKMTANVFFPENQDQIASELARIEGALRDPQTDDRYCQLYAAQQALAWALNPGVMAAPYATIQRGLVRPPLTCTQGGSKGCPLDSHPAQSLGIPAQTVPSQS
jgi:hypothetical protein